MNAIGMVWESCTQLNNEAAWQEQYLNNDGLNPNNEEDNILWMEDAIHELEDLFDEIARMSEDTRKIVAAAVREAYRLDTMYGRLREGYEVEIKVRRKVADRRKVAEG